VVGRSRARGEPRAAVRQWGPGPTRAAEAAARRRCRCRRRRDAAPAHRARPAVCRGPRGWAASRERVAPRLGGLDGVSRLGRLSGRVGWGRLNRLGRRRRFGRLGRGRCRGGPGSERRLTCRLEAVAERRLVELVGDRVDRRLERTDHLLGVIADVRRVPDQVVGQLRDQPDPLGGQPVGLALRLDEVEPGLFLGIATDRLGGPLGGSDHRLELVGHLVDRRLRGGRRRRRP